MKNKLKKCCLYRNLIINIKLNIYKKTGGIYAD